MTSLSSVRLQGLLVLLAACVLVTLIAWFRGWEAPRLGQQARDHYPELFVDVQACPLRGELLPGSRRLEERGLLLADRYPYDAGDGVRAVYHFAQAEACYRGAGSHDEAVRAGRLRTALAARVNTDYAAARLNLVTALDQARWSDALGEIHRLLLLTAHLRKDGYVEWLNKIVGRTAARASTTL